MNIVYSKHTESDRCGVALFASKLAGLINGIHYHEISKLVHCDKFYLNLDVHELEPQDIKGLIDYISNAKIGSKILILHDYRYTYQEDLIINQCDHVIYFTDDFRQDNFPNVKSLKLWTPPITDESFLKFIRNREVPFSLTFGFFSHRKKNFVYYKQFYDFMTKYFPNWKHIIVASHHTGEVNHDIDIFKSHIANDNILFYDFLPNKLLSDLITASSLGVVFYPNGILSNNTVPLSFMQCSTPLLTNFSDNSPSIYKDVFFDFSALNKINFNDFDLLDRNGVDSKDFFDSTLSWEIFIQKITSL
jgi:hypothetical protein